MKKYIVNGDLMQGVLNYLANRPFVEVFKMIQALQNVEEYKEVKEGEEGNDKPISGLKHPTSPSPGSTEAKVE